MCRAKIQDFSFLFLADGTGFSICPVNKKCSRGAEVDQNGKEYWASYDYFGSIMVLL